MTWWIALFLIQDAQADRVRTAMAASLEQQKESVRKQAESAGIAIAPWTAPVALGEMTCDPMPQVELAKMIDDVSAKQGIDAGLVREVARQESGFKPCAISQKGAEGLMQLMPDTQAQFEVSDPFSAKQSLEAGSKLLKQLLEKYHGDVTLALSAYNAGAGRVDREGGVPDISETKNYVYSILARLPLIP